MGILSKLEPEKVFEYFEKLCSVPHGSGNTAQVSAMCAGFAEELGLKHRRDEAGNVIIWKNASPGYENAEPVILQGHLDMVCAKAPDCTKDMAAEGLDLVTDGKFVWADGTSLGGDDGIAVAAALAILSDDTLRHPPLEVIFTVDEETGMDGAFALDCADIKGRRLLNLDSEEEGIFTVSCAGGVRLDCFMPGKRQPLCGESGYKVTVSGLLGGHSGVEINKGRASANQLMGRVLFAAMKKLGTLRVGDIRGGEFDNVICRRCEAFAAVAPGKEAEFEELIAEFDSVFKNEYASTDAGASLSCEKAAMETALDGETTKKILHALFALPQGVQEMSAELPGLVETSLNLGVVKTENDGLRFTVSIRSSVESRREMLAQKVRAIVELAGGSVSERSPYPGWQYRKNSPLRETVLEAYREMSGREGKVEAVHAGLECGIFAQKLPGLDAVSLGANLSDIHSPRERLEVSSVGRMYELVCRVLEKSI